MGVMTPRLTVEAKQLRRRQAHAAAHEGCSIDRLANLWGLTKAGTRSHLTDNDMGHLLPMFRDNARMGRPLTTGSFKSRYDDVAAADKTVGWVTALAARWGMTPQGAWQWVQRNCN